jgi:deoxyribodipyrimidine photo-lyase
LQQDKFDKDYKYVKKWVHDFNTSRYPLPIIDHAFARARALAAFEKAVKKNANIV